MWGDGCGEVNDEGGVGERWVVSCRLVGVLVDMLVGVSWCVS